MPTRTFYLPDDELERLKYTARQVGETPGVVVRLAVKALLGDPLPAWGRELVDELHGPLSSSSSSSSSASLSGV
jgi:hypothetical protein